VTALISHETSALHKSSACVLPAQVANATSTTHTTNNNKRYLSIPLPPWLILQKPRLTRITVAARRYRYIALRRRGTS